MWGFEDMSLLRYVGLIILILPYIFIEILPKISIENTFQRRIVTCIFFIAAIFFFSHILIQSNFDLKFNIHSGSFKDFIWHQEYYALGERVKERVPLQSSILLVDQEDVRIGNMHMPVIILRYALSEYSVGFQYSLQVDNWYDFMELIRPDYILVYTYDEYWKNCNHLLENQQTYLIKVNKNFGAENSNTCFFDSEDVISL
jgi:hypothetical protein